MTNKHRITRRNFVAAASMAGAGLALNGVVSRPVQAETPPDFPKNFLWGASTSALQIEGATKADGRGVSIWETFSARSDTIADGSTPDEACDHYHMWAQDIGLMHRAGLGAYRYSVAWPRVMPDGTGPVNDKGLDFYDRLTDGLLAAGLRPMPCLYHWDLPQALQDKGGWLNRDIAGWFTDYALAVTRRLGDRTQDWFALNEPSVVAIFGHAYGEHAPGLAKGKPALLAALHHQNLAQGTALKALRKENSKFRLGTVLSLQPAIPFSDSKEDRAAATRWDAAWNRVSLDGVMRGQLPDTLAADMASIVKPDDLETIHVPLDMLGVNYYSPMTMQYQPGRLLDCGFGPITTPRRTAMNWPVAPEGLQQILTELKELYGNPPVYITENGAAYDDHVTEGRVHDDDRIAFLRDHLRQAAIALKAGCNLKGYLVWSLLDNWEWQQGYSRRFGLTYIDYPTQRRIPKDSFAWYAKLAQSGRIE